MKNWLTMSNAIDTRLAARPARYTRLMPTRAPRRAPASDAVIAVTTCGRNIVPYCVLDRPYSSGAVKIVLAAGKVTSTIPCAAPAA